MFGLDYGADYAVQEWRSRRRRIASSIGKLMKVRMALCRLARRRIADHVMTSTNVSSSCTMWRRPRSGAGAGSNSTGKPSISRSRETGADGVLQVCPYYNKPAQEGLYAQGTLVRDTGDHLQHPAGPWSTCRTRRWRS